MITQGLLMAPGLIKGADLEAALKRQARAFEILRAAK
jgi:hypothetical protein